MNNTRIFGKLLLLFFILATILSSGCASETDLTEITDVGEERLEDLRTDDSEKMEDEAQSEEHETMDVMDPAEPQAKASGFIKLGDIKGESTDSSTAKGYIKIGDIKGESVDKGHKDWIVIESMSNPLSPDESTVSGSREASAPSLSELTVTKPMDYASPILSRYVTTGTPIPAVEIEFADPETGVVYYKFELKDVIVTSVSTSEESGDPVPTEEITMNYGKISWELTEDGESAGMSLGNGDKIKVKISTS